MLEQSLKEAKQTPEFHLEFLKLQFAEALEICRSELGLTKNAFSAQLDMPQGLYYKLMNTTVNITLKTLCKYCVLAGIFPQFSFNYLSSGNLLEVCSGYKI